MQRAGPAACGLGAEAPGAQRPDCFCVLRPGQQSQPQSSQPDYSKAWEDYYKKQSECVGLLNKQLPSHRAPKTVDFRVRGPLTPFFLSHFPCVSRISASTFAALSPRVPVRGDARSSFAVLHPSSRFSSGLQRARKGMAPALRDSPGLGRPLENRLVRTQTSREPFPDCLAVLPLPGSFWPFQDR